MKKISCIIIAIFITAISFAQTAAELYETGKKFLIQGDIDNAVLVLKKAVQTEPTNQIYMQDLASAYFYKEDYKAAISIAEQLIELPNADPYAFFLYSNIEIMQENNKNAEKVLKKGLKLHPNSGMLYNQIGILLGAKNDGEGAIKEWENGIKLDPGYAGNYYEAARYYYYLNSANAKIWAIYYGEIFANLESNSTRTMEMKELLFNSYKLLISDDNLGKKASKNDFENLFIENFNKVKKDALTGITTENLIKLRSNFLFNWYTQNASLNISLFDRLQQLLKEGHFEEYSYWLFEPIQNLAAYDNWLKTNQKQFDAFMYYHRNIVFKVKSTDYLK
jgi:hypothetical protein